jgi:hypothetical protein
VIDQYGSVQLASFEDDLTLMIASLRQSRPVVSAVFELDYCMSYQIATWRMRHANQLPTVPTIAKEPPTLMAWTN